VQVGGITATLLNSQTNPDVWRKKVEPTQKIYSWAMNNHWGTNYRAYQDGPVVFRFVLRPHRQSNPVESARFGLSRSFALIPVRASKTSRPLAPLLQVDFPEVLVSALKPADDGNALIIRLYNTDSSSHTTDITWRERKPKVLYRTDVSENPKKRITGSIKVPGHALVSLRAEF
jgi:alpha-mannosidase